METPEVLTLAEVVKKIRETSETQYNGKIYDHIREIFDSLTLREQNLLLKGLVNIALVAEYRYIDQTTGDICMISPGKVRGEEVDIETENQRELIKLKSWLVKAVTVSVVMGIVITIGLSLGLSGAASGFVSIFENVISILKVLFST